MLQEPSEKVKPFVDTAWLMIEQTLKREGAIQLLAILIDMDRGDLTFVPATKQIPNKDVYAGLIAAAVELTKADLVVMASEAWTIIGGAKLEEVPEIQRVGLEKYDHPNKAEILEVKWKSAYGEQGHQTRLLMRDPKKKKPWIGEAIDLSPKGKGSPLESHDRFFDIIFKGPTQ